MVDYLEWLAIVLGAIAVCIALWDHIADSFLVRFGWHVYASSKYTLDPPGRSTHANGSSIVVRRVSVQWTVKNKLSYPVMASFGYRGVPIPNVVWTRLSGDLIGIQSGTVLFLPPHQPLALAFEMEVTEDWSGTFTPSINLAVPGNRHTITGSVINLPYTTALKQNPR
jgi:hypothetical protein